jgi:hypothetical protein
MQRTLLAPPSSPRPSSRTPIRELSPGKGSGEMMLSSARQRPQLADVGGGVDEMRSQGPGPLVGMRRPYDVKRFVTVRHLAEQLVFSFRLAAQPACGSHDQMTAPVS